MTKEREKTLYAQNVRNRGFGSHRQDYVVCWINIVKDLSLLTDWLFRAHIQMLEHHSLELSWKDVPSVFIGFTNLLNLNYRIACAVLNLH